jgi:hypothetical protein
MKSMERTLLRKPLALRKLISKWRKRLKENGGRLEALAPHSTRPKRVRKSKIPSEIIDFIRSLREKYPRLEKR